MLASIDRVCKPVSSAVPVPTEDDDDLLEEPSQDAVYQLVEKEAGFDLIEQRLDASAIVEAEEEDAVNAQLWACDQLPDAEVGHIRAKLVKVPWNRAMRTKVVGTKACLKKPPGGSHFFGRPPVVV